MDPTIPLPPLLDPTPTFVGREAERRRLRQLWDQAAGGVRQRVLLTGPPGVGTTSLAAQLAGEVHGEGAVVLAGRTQEDMAVPYQPFVESLSQFIAHTVAPAGRLGPAPHELSRLVAGLAGRISGLGPPSTADPETERDRLFQAVDGWLAAASAEAPVLLVLDDLHWAGPATLLLLRHLARSREPARLLVVGTVWEAELGGGRRSGGLLGELFGEMERVALTGLDEPELAAYLTAAAGPVDDPDLVWLLHTETGGNPFFVEQVLEYLFESGALVRQAGRWFRERSVVDLGIPAALRAVLGARLSHCSEASQAVLEAAAVTGETFDPAVVRPACGLGEEDFAEALEEALAARLVIEAGAGQVGPVGYRFAHGLVRTAVYAGTSPPRRAALHRRVGEALEVLHQGDLDGHAPALAHHLALADDTQMRARAIGYAIRAAETALGQLAHAEAARHYRQALELVESGAGRELDRERLRLLMALGEAERRVGNQRHRTTLLEVAALARRLGDVDALTWAALANSRGPLLRDGARVDTERVAVLEEAVRAVGEDAVAVRARLLASLALELVWSPDAEPRLGHAQTALALARGSDPTTLAHVLLARQFALGSPDWLHRRREEAAELVALAEKLGHEVLLSRALFARFRTALEAGDATEADRCLGRNEALVAGLGQPTLRWLLVLNRTGRSLLAGHLDEAERLAEEGWERGRETDQPDAEVFFALQRFALACERGGGGLAEIDSWFSGRVLVEPYLTVPVVGAMAARLFVETGRPDQARATLQRLVGDLRALPPDNLWLRALSDASFACTALGDVDLAGALHDLLAPYAGQFPVMAAGVVSACAEHSLGLLARALGRLDEADARFAGAAARHERMGAPIWLARTRLEWARVLAARAGPGDRDRAELLARLAQAGVDAVGVTDLREEAERLLRTLPPG
jgi:tetratricopeptide (TPR) repeat protein